MRRRFLHGLGMVLAVAGAAVVRPVSAQNTWTGRGTSALWSDAGNWSGPSGSPTPPATDAMLFFLGSTGTSSVNNAAVASVMPKVVGASSGLVFRNDGLGGNTAGHRLSGSPLVLKGAIETLSAVTSPALAITDEIALDLQLTSPTFTEIRTAAYGAFSHNLAVSGVIVEDGTPRTLRKAGTGATLTLTGENVFTGQLQVNVGIVSVDRLENIGQPSPLGAGNLPVRLATGALYGILQYTGTGEGTNRYFQIGSGPNISATGTAWVTHNGTGPLVFTADGRDTTHPLYGNDFFNQNDGAVTSPGRMLVLNGTNAAANEIRTVIIDNVNTTTGNLGLVSPVSLTKAGSGRWIVSGKNTYTGTTTVSGGVLQVGNSGTTGTLGGGPVVNNATLSYKRSDDVTIAAAISGSGGFVQAGTGVLTFGTSQGYTGRTSIEAGTLSLGEAGSVASSSSVTVSPGATFYVADVAGGAYAVPSSQSLGGGGTVVGLVSVAGGATVSPGMSPGTLSVTDAVTFGSGGNYNWQLLSASGTAGAVGAWDLLDAGGALTIAATSSDPFRLNLWTLSGTGPDVSGSVANFSSGQSYSWTIAKAAGGITGFAADKFVINTSATNGTGGFTNPLGGGTFSIAQSGNDLRLVFTSAARSVITINVASGTQTQTQAGYPTLSGSIPMVKTGGGTLVLDQANTLTGSTTVQGGVLQLANGSALSASRLVVVAGGTGQVAPVTSAAVASLDLASGNGLVDLTRGALTIAGGMTAPDLVAEILEGRGDGSWNGTSGITSTTAAAQVAASVPRAVGWIDNGDGSLTAAYAAPGDTNIDWTIDILDASNFLAGGKFDTGLPATWNEGDFSYDGIADILDAADFFATGLYDAGSYNTASGGGVAAVPEPVTTAAAAAVALLAAAGRGGRSLRRGKNR
ncbi:MAG: beta strand repeat-containing protein [Planctomycetaceae bacterium]